MNPRDTVWGDVGPGMYVRDKQDRTWRVEDERQNQLLLQNAAGERVAMARPPATQPTTVLEPTSEEALAIVQAALGAEVMAVKEPGRPVTCPPLPRNRLDVIHSHMFMMHGVWTKTGPGSRSGSKILEFHREEHLEDAKAGAFVPHIHKESKP